MSNERTWGRGDLGTRGLGDGENGDWENGDWENGDWENGDWEMKSILWGLGLLKNKMDIELYKYRIKIHKSYHRSDIRYP